MDQGRRFPSRDAPCFPRALCCSQTGQTPCPVLLFRGGGGDRGSCPEPGPRQGGPRGGVSRGGCQAAVGGGSGRGVPSCVPASRSPMALSPCPQVTSPQRGLGSLLLLGDPWDLRRVGGAGVCRIITPSAGQVCRGEGWGPSGPPTEGLLCLCRSERADCPLHQAPDRKDPHQEAGGPWGGCSGTNGGSQGGSGPLRDQVWALGASSGGVLHWVCPLQSVSWGPRHRCWEERDNFPAPPGQQEDPTSV